jgi:hypothetical protein
VPPGSRGRIDLPASDPMLVRVLRGSGDGNVALADAPGIRVGRSENDRVRLEFGSGEYEFLVRGRP